MCNLHIEDADHNASPDTRSKLRCGLSCPDKESKTIDLVLKARSANQLALVSSLSGVKAPVDGRANAVFQPTSNGSRRLGPLVSSIVQICSAARRWILKWAVLMNTVSLCKAVPWRRLTRCPVSSARRAHKGQTRGSFADVRLAERWSFVVETCGDVCKLLSFHHQQLRPIDFRFLQWLHKSCWFPRS